MYRRVYLDTHFIDYLFDHRDDIWEGSDDALEAAEQRGEGDDQLDECAWLRMLPLFCSLNNWWLRIGERVLEQLSDIKDAGRRANLLEYALQIAEQEGVEPQLDDDNDDNDEPDEEALPPRDPRQYVMLIALGFDDDFPPPEEAQHLVAQPARRPDVPKDYPRSPEESLSRLPKTDRPLVEEALSMGCDVFLTVDRGILAQAAQIEDWFGLQIRTWTELLYAEAEADQLKINLDDWSWPGGEILNELELYTKLIPAG